MSQAYDKKVRRRPNKKRPSSAVALKNSARRVHKYSVPLPFNKRTVISLRKFKTNPARRSRRFRQWVIDIELGMVREIAIAVHGKPRRPAVKKGLNYASLRTALAVFLIVAGVASAAFSVTNLHKHVSINIPAAATKALAAPYDPTKVLPASAPVRVQIPKISVDSSLEQVGLQANGQMEMPWDITVAAWYKYSPTPGQLGPSVIVGHLDGANYANMAGVFYRLRELVPGDQVMVTRADGTVATFKVLYLKQVSQSNFPTKEVYGNINYAGIRLITCGGTFDTSTGHYDDNTVVFGALE